MKKYFEILKKCSLFKGISENELGGLLVCLGAKVVEFDKKYTILREGDKASFIGILLSGSAHIIQSDYFGNRSILSKLTAPEIFGEAFACADTQRIPISVIADEPSEVMFINREHILNTCKSTCSFHQRLIFNLMHDLAQKNILFYQKIEVTSKRSTREKLLCYLNIVAKSEKKDSFDIPFDRQELADYLGVDRSGLSAEISKLSKEGIIESHKNHFKLK